jgi:hypothetical protein
MTRHLHEPANALLYRALDLPPEERQRFVADACAGEPDLLELVKTLLSRIDQLDEFLEAPPELPAAQAPRPAIVAQPGEQLAGAHRERQMPPQLNHPDIARLVEAGNAEDGRPRFVTEPSQGVPIDRYCADMRLSLQQRVALFARACHAVHYAHQHLVIHRNLNPANIQVGPGGSPKLLDFGIDGEAVCGPLAPLFASPEQLAGQPLSISSDIYSLGAILYGLLSGRSPNAAEATGIISTLARPAPVRPSEAVAEAVARHYPPVPEFSPDELLRPDRKLARQLQGDLDHILMKAIDLDPAQRYASADAFARDLECYLAHEPIQAAPPSAHSGVPWLLRRRPLGIAAAAIAAGALVIGSAAALWHAREADRARTVAEQRFEQSRKLARGMPFEVDDALEKAPAAARAKLMGSAQAYLIQLADVRRVAGDLEGAQQAARLSLGLAKKQLKSSPGEPRLRRQLSVTQGQLGNILIEQGRTAQGLAELRKALAIREKLAASDAGNEQAARGVADARSAIAAALMATMDYASAEQQLTPARDTYAAQLRANPGDASLRAGLIELELARANVQNLQHHGRDAVQTLAALHTLAGDANKPGADAQLAARIALLDAYIQPRGTPAQAYAAAGRALGELLKQSEKDPLDTDQLRESALAWQKTGEIGLRAGQTESACRYLGLAEKRYQEFGASKRLNAIDKLLQLQLQAQRKACA